MEPLSFPGRIETAPLPAGGGGAGRDALPPLRIEAPDGLFRTDFRATQAPEDLFPGPAASPPEAPEKPRMAPETPQPDPAREQKQIQVLQNMMEGMRGRYEFGTLEASGQFYVKVVDRATSQVVAMRPFREFLEARERIAIGVGMFLDHKA